jgi:hypothetical protein
MVINNQDYSVLGLCPSSGILKNTKEHNVSETGSVSVSQPKNFQTNLMHWFSWIWFVARNFHFLFYLSFRSVHDLAQFILHISSYLLLTKPDLRFLYSYGYTDIGQGEARQKI